jgi:hypothetical protein
MEGGVAVMKPIQRTYDLYKIFIILMATILLMSWAIMGGTQEAQRGGAQK